MLFPKLYNFINWLSYYCPYQISMAYMENLVGFASFMGCKSFEVVDQLRKAIVLWSFAAFRSFTAFSCNFVVFHLHSNIDCVNFRRFGWYSWCMQRILLKFQLWANYKSSKAYSPWRCHRVVQSQCLCLVLCWQQALRQVLHFRILCEGLGLSCKCLLVGNYELYLNPFYSIFTRLLCLMPYGSHCLRRSLPYC